MKPSLRSAPSPVATAAPDAGPERAPWSMLAVMLVVTLAAYFPCLRGDFLWDDAGHVTNPELRSWSGLLRIWFEPGATQQYYPLLHSAFWLEHQLWGDATPGYHLVNVLWHAISACLFGVLLRRLAVPGATFAALVFALHPVCVESVAWISEQKNTLSTMFYLLAALAWLRFEDDRRASRYAIASLWFVAALLTKTVTATLPAALLVVAWWQRGRLSWRGDVLPLLPWFLVGIAAGLGTAWFERTHIGAEGEDFTLSAVERGLLAGRVVWFYFGKLLWPAELTFFYPRWTVDASVAWQWIFPIATLAVLAGLVWWCRRARRRGPLAAALLFGGTLFPVLGFVNVYPFIFSYVADHFQYLASLGIFALLAATFTRGVEQLRTPPWGRGAVAVSVLFTLGVLTWRQSRDYRDVVTLYQATLARNPSSWAAHLNLGATLAESGRSDEALPHLRRALELKPDHPETLNSLGDALNRLGRSREAVPLLERALAIQPRFAEAHNTLAVALMVTNRATDGIAQFERAVELRPTFVLARSNLGWALANAGRLPEAIAQFEATLRVQPNFADAEHKWGLALAMHGRVAEALPHLARAVDLDPHDIEIRLRLGLALLDVGRRDEAAVQFTEILRFDPDHAGAKQGLALARRATSGRAP